jgi:4-hydroxyproline epimerase
VRPLQRIHAIDSHTEGEPTRVVIDGTPDLGPGTAASRLAVFRREHDAFRSAVVNEPRGNDAIVGAVMLKPSSTAAVAQTIFFNNVGFLNMCVHGTIGIAATLAHLGRIGVGYHRLETPVGDVTMHLRDDGTVEVENVPSYRFAHGVRVETERHGVISGDIAWGGNWFFLAESSPISVTFANIEALTDCTWDIRRSLNRAGITGADGGEIDHIELFGPPERDDADSKNFVLCPGKAYDRSPCGTGTSAKMACLAAAGALEPGAEWRQESIVGSRFVGHFEPTSAVTPAGAASAVLPRVRGSAHVTADTQLLLDPNDPFRHGIP